MKNVLIELQKLINGSYVTQSQSYTSATGNTFFYGDSSISYKVIFIKDGFVTATAFTIPSVLSYNVELTGTTTSYTYIDGVNTRLSPSNNLLMTNNTYMFTGFVSGTSLTSSSWALYWNNGTLIYSSTSNNPTGNTFTHSLFIPFGLNGTEIYSNLTYIKDGNTNNINKVYYITQINNESFVADLIDFGESTGDEEVMLRWFIIMVITLSVIVAGATLGFTGLNLLVIPVLAWFTYIGWLNWAVSAVMIVIALIMFIGSDRK